MTQSAGAERIVALTSGDEVDCGALHGVGRELGDGAIDPLLDALAASPSRAVRECIVRCLEERGDEARRRAASRTGDPRWYVVRNLVALVARGPLPDGFDLHPFLAAGDARIRVEAVAGIRWLEEPEAAWSRALEDPDPRVVTAALRLVEPVTPGLVEPLARLARGSEVEAMQLLAVRALGRSGDPSAVPALLSLAGASRGLFGRLRLRGRGPVAMAALEELAGGFPRRPEVVPVLEAAARASDARLREAVRRPDPPAS